MGKTLKNTGELNSRVFKMKKTEIKKQQKNKRASSKEFEITEE